MIAGIVELTDSEMVPNPLISILVPRIARVHHPQLVASVCRLLQSCCRDKLNTIVQPRSISSSAKVWHEGEVHIIDLANCTIVAGDGLVTNRVDDDYRAWGSLATTDRGGVKI